MVLGDKSKASDGQHKIVCMNNDAARVKANDKATDKHL